MKNFHIIITIILILFLGPAFSFAQEEGKKIIIERALNGIEDTNTISPQEERVIVPEVEKKIEILIDARLIKIRLNEEHKQGVDWEAIVSHYQRLDLSRSRKEEEGPGRDTLLSIGTVTNEDYAVLLEALEVVGQMSDLVNPKITAAVNREAKIVWDTHMPGDGFEMQMGIAPTLADEGILIINLDPRLRWITGDGLVAETGEEALYSSPVGIEVRVKNKETIVIGGLLQEREIKRTLKFPLLGDLPLVGFAFRRQNKLIEKTEYIIFLSIEREGVNSVP